MNTKRRIAQATSRTKQSPPPRELYEVLQLIPNLQGHVIDALAKAAGIVEGERGPELDNELCQQLVELLAGLRSIEVSVADAANVALFRGVKRVFTTDASGNAIEVSHA